MTFSTIPGSNGASDSFVGTSGVDTILLLNEAGPLLVGAQQDSDVIRFSSGVGSGLNYTLKGGAGNDTIADENPLGTILVKGFINGNAGADTFTVQLRNSTAFGGRGNDLLNIPLASNGSRVNGNAGNDTVNATAVVGSSVLGGRGDDAINISGVVSSGTIQAGLGNDTINLTSLAAGQSITASVLNGNAGHDLIQQDNSAGPAGVDLGSFAGTTLFGGEGNDTINLPQSGAGAALVLRGGKGNDLLIAGGNADVIHAGQGADRIRANAGNDTISGGTGTDTITGGAGGDRFVQRQGDSSAATASTLAAVIGAGNTIVFANGVDVVTDFAAANDTVALHAGGIANGGPAGVLSVGANAAATVPGNFAIRGTWTAGNNTFTVDGVGADILLGTATAGNLTIASSFGHSSIVLQGGFAGFTAANVVA